MLLGVKYLHLDVLANAQHFNGKNYAWVSLIQIDLETPKSICLEANIHSFCVKQNRFYFFQLSNYFLLCSFLPFFFASIKSFCLSIFYLFIILNKVTTYFGEYTHKNSFD